MASPLLDEARRFRARLMAMEAQATGQMTREYGRIYRNVNDKISALEKAFRELPAGAPMKEYQYDRLRELRAQIEQELQRFGVQADRQMIDNSRAAIKAGTVGADGMMRAAGVEGALSHMSPSAVETMLGFMQPSSPLHAALTTRLGPTVGRRVEQKLLDAIAFGQNPRQVARGIVREQMGVGLTWAMTTSRTSMLYAYREAARAQYAENDNIVQGWFWLSARDGRVCLACLAKDNGEMHLLTETLNDHYQGRCTPAPALSGMDAPQSGQAWFEQQPAEQQRYIMGAERYKAWQADKFAFGDMATTGHDQVYGPMVKVKPLTELTQ